MIPQIRPEIVKIAKQAKRWRKAMHTNPGIAYNEKEAGGLVLDKLAKWGYGTQIDAGWGKNPGWNSKLKGKGGYGVVLTIDGNKGCGETIGIRADMDALPITEETGLAYASKNKGVMHACGHDGHTATLLAVAKYYQTSENRNFKGQLKLIFQPAEEGAKGAKAMLNEGLLKKHPMDAVFAMHNWPDLPYGQIAVRSGAMMAASDYFTVKFTGKSAHAGMPAKGISAFEMMEAFANQMPRTYINSVNSEDSQVVSVGYFGGGNEQGLAVIPAAAVISGTVRTFSPEMRASIEEKFKFAAQNIAKKRGGQIAVNYRAGSPATINDPEEATILHAVSRDIIGEDNLHTDFNAAMTAEDFGFILEQVPGAYIWIGQGDPDHPDRAVNQPLHNPQYDYNDDVTALAAETFVSLVEHRLG